MNEEFKNKCCRCGFCCISENCPMSIEVFKVKKHGKLCPGLQITDNTATCLLAEFLTNEQKEMFGFGTGCCIKARAYKNGVEYDFASLPDELKIFVAQKSYKGASK